MLKISRVLLLCLLVCGLICFELHKKPELQKETQNQNLNRVEDHDFHSQKNQQIMQNDDEEANAEKESSSFDGASKIEAEQKAFRSNSKFSTHRENNRLLSDDNHPEGNNNQNDNGSDDSSNGGPKCSPERCLTCVNLQCTQCKLGSNSQEKYLLINGRCFESDNQTSDHSNHVEQDHKWEDHEKYNEQGQVSYGGRKYKCQPGCKVCNSTADITKCTTCMDGFALDTTAQKCMKCDDKCVTCNSNNIQNCTSCYPGWTISGTDIGGFTCSKCQTNHCGQCSTVDSCTSCKNFYFLYLNDTCESCMSNCRFCLNISMCSQCFSGYFLTVVDSSQTCVLCASGCSQCTSLTDCVNCYPGYFLNNKTNTCDKCSQNCWNCNSSTNCTRCVMGYQFVNNTCVSYIQDCAVMNTDNTCQQCFVGYTLSDKKTKCTQYQTNDTNVCGQNQYRENNTCLKCGVTVQNCQKCNNVSCMKCKPQYFQENNGTTCTLCSSVMTGCKKCDNSVFCARCDDGYFMEQDRNGTIFVSYGNCIVCDTNCLTCNQKATYCTSCKSQYSLSTGRTCVPSNQFDFTLLLNLDLNQFPAKIAQFKTELAKLVQDESVSSLEKQNFVQITKIASGSIKVQGTLSASSSSALQSTLSNFNTALSTGSTFSGIHVLSSKTQQKSSENDTPSSSSKTGMIIGIIVGVVCALIITIVVIYFCCLKKTSTQVQDINFDEKKSGSTNEDIAATQAIRQVEIYNLQQMEQYNQVHVTGNPKAVGPEYFY